MIGMLFFLATSLFLQVGVAAPPESATSTRFVFISDSHGLGTFGKTIDEWLRSRPQTKFDYYASGGSASYHWMKQTIKSKCGYEDHSYLSVAPAKKFPNPYLAPTLESVINFVPAQNETGVVLINLGTNFSPDVAAQSYDLVWTKKLLKVVAAKIAAKQNFKCIWIGPPNMTYFGANQIESIYAVIRKSISAVATETSTVPCELIDSRKHSTYPVIPKGSSEKVDGIHYDYMPSPSCPEGAKQAAIWAKGIISEIENYLKK